MGRWTWADEFSMSFFFFFLTMIYLMALTQVPWVHALPTHMRQVNQWEKNRAQKTLGEQIQALCE